MYFRNFEVRKYNFFKIRYGDEAVDLPSQHFFKNIHRNVTKCERK